MNMIVAAHARLNFNEYAAQMLPVAVVGWLIAYAILRVVFVTELGLTPAMATPSRSGAGLEPGAAPDAASASTT